MSKNVFNKQELDRNFIEKGQFDDVDVSSEEEEEISSDSCDEEQ